MTLSLDNGLIHVSAPEALTPANIHDVFPEFRILDPESPPGLLSTDPSATLTSPTYKPGEWIPLQVARDNFKLATSPSNDSNGNIANKVTCQRLSGLEGARAFDTWAGMCAALDPAEAHETRNTVDEIWKRFARCFGVTQGLSYYEPIFRGYTRAIFEHCLEEGISYVEVRIVFSFPFMTRASGKKDFSHSEWMLVFQDELNKFKSDLAAKGLSHKFIGAKVIYTVLRFLDFETVDWCLKDCIELKKQFPGIICGFDLVGQEDNGRPLIDFADKLLAFQKEVVRQGLYIPFLFHAGETLGDGTSTDQNLYDAILLGTKRIGHGFSIARHPKLMDMCRDGKVLLEVCPISNEILRLTSSMPTHPLPAVLNNGVPVALSSDDPAIFGSLGLAYDFYQVFVASEINGLTTLGTMAFDSIQWAEMDATDKELSFRQWQEAWDEFVDRVVNNAI